MTAGLVRHVYKLVFFKEQSIQDLVKEGIKLDVPYKDESIAEDFRRFLIGTYLVVLGALCAAIVTISYYMTGD